MDFFAAEDRARRATVQLVFLYLLAIVAVVIVTDAALAFVIAAYTTNNSTQGSNPPSFAAVYLSLLPYLAATITLVVIVATLFKASELRGGGTTFGELLGGRWMSESPTDPGEERLKNVVEEMAIAAGVRPPAICILDDESGINAFAAGTINSDPVIGVTKGCITQLTRDELQAIIGHEFSHILHNDTTLNTRAYAMIFGLLAISVIGLKLLGSMQYMGGRSSRNGGGIILLILAVGAILAAVGWLGGLAGRIIRAAIVRQREFLADASAVQYTRNADSVASALYKMATHGSHLAHPTGEEAEHFLFGSGAGGAWGKFGLTRTHPKTTERIHAVRPGFEPSAPGAIRVEAIGDDDQGDSTFMQPSVSPSQQQQSPLTNSLPMGIMAAGMMGGVQQMRQVPVPPPGAMPDASQPPMQPVAGGQTPLPHATVGTSVAANPAPALHPMLGPNTPPDDILAKIPINLHSLAIDPIHAAPTCFALAAADLTPDKWESLLSSFGDTTIAEIIKTAATEIKTLTLDVRMAILDTTVPVVKRTPMDQQKQLVSSVAACLRVVPQPDIITLAVFWRLTRYCGFSPPKGLAITTWQDGSHHLAVLMATLVRIQCGPGLVGATSYQNCVHHFTQFGAMPTMPTPTESLMTNIETALQVLGEASAITRQATVAAAAQIVADEQLPEPPADVFLRLICDAAACAVPDLFDRWI